MTREDAEAIQLDEQSETMRRTAAAMRAYLPADLATALEGWDGKADAGSPRYLVARALRRAARERALKAWGAPTVRWGLEGEHNHWYPSMRLFRQQRRGDWEGVIERVAAALTIALPGLGRGEG